MARSASSAQSAWAPAASAATGTAASSPRQRRDRPRRSGGPQGPVRAEPRGLGTFAKRAPRPPPPPRRRWCSLSAAPAPAAPWPRPVARGFPGPAHGAEPAAARTRGARGAGARPHALAADCCRRSGFLSPWRSRRRCVPPASWDQTSPGKQADPGPARASLRLKGGGGAGRLRRDPEAPRPNPILRAAQGPSTEGISSGNLLDQLTFPSGYSLHLDMFSFSVYHLIIEIASCPPPLSPPLGRNKLTGSIPPRPSPLTEFIITSLILFRAPPPPPFTFGQDCEVSASLFRDSTTPGSHQPLPFPPPSWANTFGQRGN